MIENRRLNVYARAKKAARLEWADLGLLTLGPQFDQCVVIFTENMTTRLTKYSWDILVCKNM